MLPVAMVVSLPCPFLVFQAPPSLLVPHSPVCLHRHHCRHLSLLPSSQSGALRADVAAGDVVGALSGVAGDFWCSVEERSVRGLVDLFQGKTGATVGDCQLLRNAYSS